MCSADFGIVEVKGPEAAVMKSCHVTWDLKPSIWSYYGEITRRATNTRVYEDLFKPFQHSRNVCCRWGDAEWKFYPSNPDISMRHFLHTIFEIFPLVLMENKYSS